MTVWIVLLVVVVVAVLLVGIYNGLVSARQAYRNAFAQIDVQLTRRYDLIPNLIETAKAFMAHERDTLEAVIVARNAASVGLRSATPGDAGSMQNLAQAEAGLSGALGKMFALSEAYPDLKSNQNMMQLSEELTTTENRVAFARQAYNDSVMSYNTKREVFPNNLLAGQFGFSPAAFLEQDDPAKREAMRVSF
jgi:LemA protein